VSTVVRPRWSVFAFVWAFGCGSPAAVGHGSSGTTTSPSSGGAAGSGVGNSGSGVVAASGAIGVQDGG
jgi:hypothetical protein